MNNIVFNFQWPCCVILAVTFYVLPDEAVLLLMLLVGLKTPAFISFCL